MIQVLCQAALGAPLELKTTSPTRSPPEHGSTVEIEVLSCALSPWDLRPPPPDQQHWPRIPGGVLVGREVRSGQLLACGGFLPCGDCGPCRAGLHLACGAPLRPGWNLPGGLATRAILPERFLTPGLDERDDLAAIVLVVARAGTTYQAVASADMAPGDTVILHGDAGPGALPIRVLEALGLRALLLADGALDQLSCCRCHIIDLQPSRDSIGRWIRLVTHCRSCTLLGPDPLIGTFAIDQLLGGQSALRWVRDLHPHLMMDLAGLVLSGRVAVPEARDASLGWNGFCRAFDDLLAGAGECWPVLRPQLTG